MLGLIWLTRRDFDQAARRHIAQLAAGAASAMQKLPQNTPPRPHVADLANQVANVVADPTVAVLDALLDPVLLCDPVVEADRIVDCQITHANPAAVLAGRGPTDLKGRSSLSCFRNPRRMAYLGRFKW